jgi:hypothetical protein
VARAAAADPRIPVQDEAARDVHRADGDSDRAALLHRHRAAPAVDRPVVLDSRARGRRQRESRIRLSGTRGWRRRPSEPRPRRSRRSKRSAGSTGSTPSRRTAEPSASPWSRARRARSR